MSKVSTPLHVNVGVMDEKFAVKLPYDGNNQYFGVQKSSMGFYLYLRTPRGYRRIAQAPFDTVKAAKVWVQNHHLSEGAIEA